MIQDELIGRQLGNFRIEGFLGRGGMAVVYHGWDVALLGPGLRRIRRSYSSSQHPD